MAHVFEAISLSTDGYQAQISMKALKDRANATIKANREKLEKDMTVTKAVKQKWK
jgi:hypothetical protein